MNATRRKELNKLIEQLEDIKSQIENLQQEEQDAYDNLPESLQDSERGERIQEPQINQRRNAAVKEGYKEAIHILCNRIESYSGIKERCHSVQSRAIAVLAVDFLHGECEHKVLCNVPIKKL